MYMKIKRKTPKIQVELANACSDSDSRDSGSRAR